MLIMQKLSGRILTLIVLASAGCSTQSYMQTPTVSGPKASVELPMYERGFPNIHIHKIDDVYTPTLAKKFSVEAGTRELVLSCQYTGFGTRAYFGRQTLKFTATSGHIYEARIKKIDKRRCDIQLVDKSTKTVVSEVITLEQDYPSR